jgi:hypothetical protein
MDIDNYFTTTFKENDYDGIGSKTPEIRGLHKIKKMVPLSNIYGEKYMKQVTLKVYSSGDVGSNIRNAENGLYTPYIVGSKYENLFFSVLDTTVQSDLRGGSIRLYYDSPEQYESHQSVRIDEDTRARWYEKRNFFRIMFQEEKERRTRHLQKFGGEVVH